MELRLEVPVFWIWILEREWEGERKVRNRGERKEKNEWEKERN